MQRWISLQNSIQVALYTNKNVEILTHDSILKLDCETRYVILQNKYPHNLIDPTAQFTHPKPNRKKIILFSYFLQVGEHGTST